MIGRVAASVLSVLLLFSCQKPSVSFEQNLSQSDIHMAAGSMREAGESILGAAESAVGRTQWLRTLKRAYRLGAALESYEVLYLISGMALDAIGGAEEIAALYVFACLRTGRTERAYQVSREQLNGDKWIELANEAALKARATRGDVTFLRDEEGPVLDAVRSPEPATLMRAADLFGESRFALDAALLYAADGDMGLAASAIGPYAGFFPVPAALLNYDAERYELAHEILTAPGLTNSDYLSLLVGDILIRLGLSGEAAESYRLLIAVSPNLSWIPYVNLAWILIGDGKYDEADDSVHAGKSLFPESRYLGIAEIELALARNDTQTAVALLESYREKYPADFDLVALQARILPTHANLLRMDSLLWEAFQRYPKDQRIATYLAENVVAEGQVEGIVRFLEIWEEANGKTEWSIFLRGYAALAEALPEIAEGYFLEAWRVNPRWQTAYNIAVISRCSGRFARALEFLRLAEYALERGSDAEKENKALVRTQTARVLYEQGNLSAARREAEYAAGLDTGSTEAHLILKLLESRSN